MTKKKRIVLIAACGAVLLAALAAVLFRFVIPKETGVCGDTATYKIVGNTLYVKGIGEMWHFRDPDGGMQFMRSDYEIPWRESRDSIRRVVIGEEIESIGGCSFMGCVNLREVKIADSVELISGGAFSGCVMLTEISAKEVCYIGIEAFADCTALTSVDFPAEKEAYGYVMERAFINCTALERVNLGAEAHLYDMCFSGCTSLKEIEFEELYVVEKSAFSGCEALQTFPLERLSEYFLNDPEYDPRVYPEVLGGGVFKNCTGLEYIAFPDWAEWVPTNFFLGCTGLEEVTLPEGLVSIENNAFAQCTGIETLVLPSTVTEVDESAFRGWTAEQTIVVTDPDILPELAECAANIVTQ